MEQHPVPRNITSFQFKLVGDMTLKQFGYLASGAILGYTLFKILPLPFIFNATFGGLVFFLGFAFAFLPLADRPLDQWLVAFIKSVYSPTQFFYFKKNEPPEILTQPTTFSLTRISHQHEKNFAESKKLLENYLAKLPRKQTDYFEQNETIMINQALSLFSQNTPFLTQSKIQPPAIDQFKVKQPISGQAKSESQKQPPPPVHLTPQANKPEKTENSNQTNQQVKELIDQLAKLKQQIKEGEGNKNQNSLLEKKFLELEQKLTILLTERDRLTQEIARLKQNQSMTGKIVTPQLAQEESSQTTVKIIPQAQVTKVGILNPPNAPNLISGVVKDNNNNLLVNVLITVKDVRGTPLRALRTNKLGQFFASTPLTNGDYVLEVEDPMKRYSFDLIQLKLRGEIVQPLEIIAKRKPDPIRERLAKELFQKNFG